jgi:hypothetical protein
MATRIDVSVGEAQLRQKAREQTEANRMVKLEALERSKEEARLRDKLAEVRGFLGVGIDGKPLYGRLMPNRYKPDEPAAFLTSSIKVGVLGGLEVDMRRDGITRQWVLQYYAYENGAVASVPTFEETLASFPDLTGANITESYDATALYDQATESVGFGGADGILLMTPETADLYPTGITLRRLRRQMTNFFDWDYVLLPVRESTFILLVYGYAAQGRVEFETIRRLVTTLTFIEDQIIMSGGVPTWTGESYYFGLTTETVLSDNQINTFNEIQVKKAYLISPSAVKPIAFPDSAWDRLKDSVDQELPPLVSFGTAFNTWPSSYSGSAATGFQTTTSTGPVYTDAILQNFGQQNQADYSVFSFRNTYGYGYVGSSPSQEVWTPGVYSFMKNLPIATPSPISKGATNVAVQNSSGFKWGAVRPFPVPAGTTVQAKGKGKTYAYGPYAWTWDWERSGYCRQQLLELGFTPEDLTP